MSELTVRDLGTLFDGPHATPTRIESGPYFLNIASLNGGRLELDQSDHVSETDFQKWTKRVEPTEGDLLFSYETRLGEAALMPADVRACLGRRMALIRPNRSVINPKFLLYYYLSPGFQRTIEQHTIHGATVNRISLSTMGAWPVSIPSLDEQQAIAEVLGALDDKIAGNTKLVSLIDAHMGLEYKATVLDSASALPLNEVAEFHNRRRVPLSARERERRRGDVPYYGASGVFGTVDTAIFNEPLVLVGEDGSVINGDGTPVSQYIWGPAWVNNHAHVLTGKGISTELLFLAVRRTQVATLVTGAVQPKINMGNLKRLTLDIPSVDRRGRLEQIVKTETASKRAAIEESRTLATTRDALLPQLMSGRLRVKDAEKVLENAGV